MTAAQAFDLIIRATGMLTLTREDHGKIEAALTTLRAALGDKLNEATERVEREGPR